jgi:RNA polymerase sigma-70 factor, ECF subfamily
MNPNCDAAIRPCVADGNDEAALVSAIQLGAAGCFETLVNRYERRIFSLAKRIVKNDCDAEDATQEAFFKAFEHIKTFEGNSRFYTWMVRIVLNQAIATVRKRRPAHFSLDDPIGTEEHSFFHGRWKTRARHRKNDIRQSEFASALSSAMGTLDSTLRIVLQLRDIENLSTDETASLLGISVPAVKSRLLRARQKLREKLNAWVREGSVPRRGSVTSQREVM